MFEPAPRQRLREARERATVEREAREAVPVIDGGTVDTDSVPERSGMDGELGRLQPTLPVHMARLIETVTEGWPIDGNNSLYALAQVLHDRQRQPPVDNVVYVLLRRILSDDLASLMLRTELAEVRAELARLGGMTPTELLAWRAER